MTSPLRVVLRELSAGAVTTADVARRTGLPIDVVRGAADQLLRAGLVGSVPLTTRCPFGECGSCSAAATGCATTRAGKPPIGRQPVAKQPVTGSPRTGS